MGDFDLPTALTHRRNLGAALFLLVIASAAILRVIGIGAESLWHDEVLTTYSCQVPLPQVVPSVLSHETSPPGYFALVNVWTNVAGQSDESIRLFSAIVGTITVALLGWLGRVWFNPRVGLTAAALLAFCPFHIAYSQEARAYALLMLVLLACLWSFVELIRSGSTIAQIGYVVSAALALYVHTFAIFTLLAMILFYFQRVTRRVPAGVTVWRWLVLQAAVVVLFGPWIGPTRTVATMGLPWLHRSAGFVAAMTCYAGSVTGLALVACLCLIAVSFGWHQRDDRILLLLLLAILPVLGPIAYGIFTPRYGIGALIGLVLLCAYAAARLGRATSVGLVVLASIGWWTSSTFGHARYPGYTEKPNVRSAAEYLRYHVKPGDVLINGPSGLMWPAVARYARFPNLTLVENQMELDGSTPSRVWMIARDRATADAAVDGKGYAARSRHAFDGLVLLELQRIATTEPVPSTAVSSFRPLR